MMDPYREQHLQIIEAQSDINGQFTQIRRLGSSGGGGHFSLMFAAKRIADNTDLVLKVYNPAHNGDSYRIRSFQREAEILGQLAGSDDIIQLVYPESSFGVTLQAVGGQSVQFLYIYYAMEMAQTSVEEVLAADRWTVERRLVAFRSMCRAIQRIHSKSIMHRDLKPANFLVMGDESVKLSDFGTSRLLDPSIPGIVPAYSLPPGDIRYTSPEMLAALHDEVPAIAYWADIYALGAILFELFTGTQLGLRILDQTFQQLLMANRAQSVVGKRRYAYDGFVSSIVAKYPLPSLAQFNSDVPKCILHQVDQLYQSMAALDFRSRLRTVGQGFERNVQVADTLSSLQKPDLSSVFRQIDICLVILRNQQVYERRQAMKHHRRASKARAARGATK